MDSYNLFPEVCHTSLIRAKMSQKALSSRKQIFFEIFFLSTSWLPKNRSYQLHNIFQNTLWTLQICSLRFVMFDNTRKIRPQFVFTGKIAIFFYTKFVFPTTSQLLTWYGNDLITSTVFVRVLFGPLQIVP